MIRPIHALALALLASSAAAQFDYKLDFDVEERTWAVEGRFANPGGEDVDYWIARWTPGAYHLADFGRFVDGLTAEDGAGNALEVDRIDDSHFVIGAAGAEEIVVRYQAMSISEGIVSHGAVIDVESNRIRDDYAYVTPVSLFGFVPERMGEPFSLAVELPDGWQAATVLRQSEDGVYHAPSYQRFEDSPLLFSPTLTTFELEAGGKPMTVTLHGLVGEAAEAYAEDCRRISQAAIDLMGGAPYDRYHYLIGFVPEGQGSGLEHSDSTLILLKPGSTNHGLVAHEFFHLYCAERIHVEAIRAADFTRPLVTGTIWVNESMTEYMTQHVLLQAGLMSVDEFFRAVGPSPMVEQVAKNVGAPVEVSRKAVDWQSMQDLSSFALKMYHHGPRLMLALDLEMRGLSDGERGVVDFLRHVMAEYDAAGKGFPEDGVLEILEEVAGGDLDDFYATYIEANGNPEFSEHLDVIGCELGEGGIRRVADPTPQQEAAYEDFLSPEG